MNTTERYMPSSRLIFRRAQQLIDQTMATTLPDHVRYEAAWDHILQAGRELDRLAAHQALHRTYTGGVS